MYFEYGEKELNYLKSKDRKLAEVIDIVGHLDRQVDEDLFSAVIHHMIGQQISTKAQQTIWNRMQRAYKEVSPDIIGRAKLEELQSFGITFRKAEYIKDFSEKVLCGAFDIAAVRQMPDKEAITTLSGLKGIGVWTAEMILLFCLQRPNILSYGDLAIQRGMRMVYRHKEMKKELFEKYYKRLSPYCSTASLYFWAVAGGAVKGLEDPAPKKRKDGK